MTVVRSIALLCIILIGNPSLVSAQARQRDLAELSLDALLDIEVTLATKEEQTVFKTPAAIYVISAEDIRRSGATSIPEALRLVPGLNVARIDSNKWAISARGFNSRMSNRMLALMDGRIIYTNLFAGVFWDSQDTLLEDIDRIEVIRGPGATLWGSNAVNGVINIITKKAYETHGGSLTVGGGSAERAFGSLRYGSSIGDSFDYRVYAKYFDRSSSLTSSGQKGSDSWHVERTGFRFEWRLSSRDTIEVQSDVIRGNAGGTSDSVTGLTPPTSVLLQTPTGIDSGNLAAAWERKLSDDSRLTMRFHFDHGKREEPRFGERRDTLNFEIENTQKLGERQEIVWGGGYRISTDKLRNSPGLAFEPAQQKLSFSSGFVQDDIEVVRNRLHLVFGSKFENNTYGGFEVSPTARFIWTLNPRQSVWGSVSHAAKSPSRAERDLRLLFSAQQDPSGLLMVTEIQGNPDLLSEGLVAYEFGYRVRPSSHFYTEFSTFYNRYDRLAVVKPLQPTFQGSYLLVPVTFDNLVKGTTYGGEVNAIWKAYERWTVKGAYSFLNPQLHNENLPPGVTANALRDSPRHQFQLQSLLNLTSKLESDASLYIVGALSASHIPSYTQLNWRLGWNPTPMIGLDIVFQNLLKPGHMEFGSGQLANATEVRRGVYGKLTWRF